MLSKHELSFLFRNSRSKLPLAARHSGSLRPGSPGARRENRKKACSPLPRCLDSDEAKTGTLRSGRTPIYELGTRACSPITQPNTCFSSRSAHTTLGRRGVSRVGTSPLPDGDHSYLRSAAQSVAEHLNGAFSAGRETSPAIPLAAATRW